MAVARETVGKRHGQQHAELTGEVAAHARMHLALLVEEPTRRVHREHTFVPDARMDVDAEAPIRPEGLECLWLQIVARQRDRNHERPTIERPEELAAVGVIVAMPQEHAPLAQLHAGPRRLRLIAEADDIVAADRLVTADQLIALPFTGEDAFGRAALDAGAGIESPPARQRPGNDLDPVLLGVAHDLAVALERLRIGANQRHIEEPQPWRHIRIEIIENDRIAHDQAALPRSSPASARSISFTTLSRP